MITRKAILLSFFLCVGSLSSFAQNKDSLKTTSPDIGTKKFYYQFGVGYLFNAGIGYNTHYVQTKDGNYSTDNYKASFGKGFDISFAMGGKFTSNLGLEVELGYTVGGKNITESQYYISGVAYPLTVKETISYRANTLRANPKLVFEIPISKVNAFYGKLGYLIGSGKTLMEGQEEWLFDNGAKGSGSYERRFSGGMVSGSTFALGFRFEAEKDVSFFIEVVGNNLHRKFDRSVLTQSIANGENVLADVSYYYRQTNFVEKAVYPAGPIDEDKPRELPSYLANYSSTGFKFGFIKHF
jgi:hypothetical protein